MTPSLLSYRQFCCFWLARTATIIAQSSTVVAIGWQIYDISRQTMSVRGASFNIGLIGLVQFLPLLGCTLLSGLVIDRFERLAVARLAIALLAVCASGLAWLAWSGSGSLSAYFLVAAFLGVVRAFYMPSMTSLVSRLVPPPVLPRAVAAGAMAGRAGAIIGPIVGGFAYGIAPHYGFLASVVLTAVSVTALSQIEAQGGTLPASRKDGIWREMAAGLYYVGSSRLLLGVITLDLFAIFLGGITALLPVFARDVLAIGPMGLGLLRSAPAVGALLVASYFSVRPLKGDVGFAMLQGVALFGAATVLFGLSRWLPLSLLCLVALGAGDMASVYVRQSMLQLATPDHMRGRVNAISTLSVSASNELGEMESGMLSAAAGPIGAVIVSGAAALAVSLLWMKLFPEIIRTRRFPDMPQSQVGTAGQHHGPISSTNGN